MASSRNVLSRLGAGARQCLVRPQVAWASTSLSEKFPDPSALVTGVTVEDLEKDPNLRAFFEANFSSQEAKGLLEEDEQVMEEAESVQVENSMNIGSLHCFKRHNLHEEGSRRCRRLRQSGEIPGLLHGGDPTLGIQSNSVDSRVFVKTPWNLLQRELDRHHRNFESCVYDLTVYEGPDDEEGSIHRVLPRDVQRHPIQNKVYCVNYLRYFPGRPIKIPLTYINEEESAAMKRGGFIAPVNRFIECVVEDGVPIPEAVEVECTDLRLKDVVRVDRLVFPEGVKPSHRLKLDKYLVGTVFGRRGDDTGEEAEGEETEEESAG